MTVEELICELQKLPKDLNIYTSSDYFGADVKTVGVKIRNITISYADKNEEKLGVFFEPLLIYGNIKSEHRKPDDSYHIDVFPRKVGEKWM